MGRAKTNRLEPEAHERFEEMADKYGYIEEGQGQSMMLHSIAISLKRIADVMEGQPQTKPHTLIDGEKV